MKIKHKYGLLLVDIVLTFNGKSKIIENMVVDTGAAKTLISQDVVKILVFKLIYMIELLLILELVEKSTLLENE